VRARLATEQADADRERLFNDVTTKMVDLVNKNPTALDPAAKAAGLTVQTLGPFPRGGGPGIAGNRCGAARRVRRVAIQDGLVSDHIEVGTEPRGHAARHAAHARARVARPAQVRNQIVAAIRAERTQKAAQAIADGMVAQLKAGRRSKRVAAERGWRRRRCRTSARRADAGSRSDAGLLLRAGAAAGKVSPGSVRLADGSHVVFAVDKVTRATRRRRRRRTRAAAAPARAGGWHRRREGLRRDDAQVDEGRGRRDAL
jgi:peptidyl-prolyl cis-trans isomerase D